MAIKLLPDLETQIRIAEAIENLSTSSSGDLIYIEEEIANIKADYVTQIALNLQLLEKQGLRPNGSDLLVIDGKINSVYIDSLYTTDIEVVETVADMLALPDVKRGDLVIVTNTETTYILKQDPSNDIDNWVQLLTKPDVVSVNGKTGVVVLGISDIDSLQTSLNSKLDVGVYENDKLNIPSKTSDLTNDTGYITGYTETDPIFTAWDKSTGISITKSQVSDLIEATQALSGLMSATDKERLDVLHALLEEDTENNVVDSINEVLAIFNNYPEGADLVTALAGKVDKVTGKGLSTNDLTNTLKSNYDTAYGWGNHATENYLKSITKAMVEAVLTGTITTHNHDGVYEPSFTKNSAFNKNFGTTAGTVTQGNDSRLSDARPASDVSAWAKKSNLAIGDIPTGTTESTVALGNHTHSQYLTSFTESDPTVPSHVKSITSANISSWNEKQDKLTAGDNITINPNTNVISSSGGGGTEYELTKLKIDTALIGSSDDSIQLGNNASAESVNSTAIGAESHAEGNLSIALGYNVTAGGFATAIGNRASASGNQSVVLGNQSVATSMFGTALGSGSSVSGNQSVAIGNMTSATEMNSVALGSTAIASSMFSTALGYGAKANGQYSSTLGFNTSASDFSTALGGTSSASGVGSIALGFGAKAEGIGSIAIGRGTKVTEDNVADFGSDRQVRVNETPENDRDATSKKYVDDKTTIKEQNTNTDIKFWTGSQAEYNSLSVKDVDTIYFIEEE